MAAQPHRSRVWALACGHGGWQVLLHRLPAFSPPLLALPVRAKASAAP